jgi:hypothetical protein
VAEVQRILTVLAENRAGRKTVLAGKSVSPMRRAR